MGILSDFRGLQRDFFALVDLLKILTVFMVVAVVLSFVTGYSIQRFLFYFALISGFILVLFYSAIAVVDAVYSVVARKSGEALTKLRGLTVDYISKGTELFLSDWKIFIGVPLAACILYPLVARAYTYLTDVPIPKPSEDN
jgi:ABC-type maltose transport system permease subunit